MSLFTSNMCTTNILDLHDNTWQNRTGYSHRISLVWRGLCEWVFWLLKSWNARFILSSVHKSRTLQGSLAEISSDQCMTRGKTPDACYSAKEGGILSFWAPWDCQEVRDIKIQFTALPPHCLQCLLTTLTVIERPSELCCHQHVKALWILKSASTKLALLCFTGDVFCTFLLISILLLLKAASWSSRNMFSKVPFILNAAKFLLLSWYESRTSGEIFHDSNQQVSWYTWKILAMDCMKRIIQERKHWWAI